jgi:hypothetical protein
VPPQTRVDELEGAIRAVCEPHFDRPLKDISLGQVLLRLFQTSRRFNVEIQPQLVLLQKTLLNVEGLGRDLDPELDLWNTAKPFLERWMKEQVGWEGLVERLKNEAPRYVHLLPELPRLLHAALRPPARVAADPAHPRGAAPGAAPLEPLGPGRCLRGGRFPRRAARSAGVHAPALSGRRAVLRDSVDLYTVGFSRSKQEPCPFTPIGASVAVTRRTCCRRSRTRC